MSAIQIMILEMLGNLVVLHLFQQSGIKNQEGWTNLKTAIPYFRYTGKEF